MTKKQRYWKKHIAVWQEGGGSQAAYCRKQGLSIKNFGYYKRRFASTVKIQEVVIVASIAMP